MAITSSYSKIVTTGLVFAYDTADVNNSYLGEPTTNLLPTPTVNGYPTTGNGWGTYNTNQYCGSNGCGAYWPIPSISSVSNNIVTTSSAHTMRSFDVLTPQSSGGGLTAGTNYVVKKISSTQFSLHAYNGSQDGSQGYINPTTGFYKVHDDFANDTRVSINSTSFPTMWFGQPHLPNSGLIKEVITNGFDGNYPFKSDCLRLHWYRPDGVTDGMAYGVTPSVTNGVTYTVSFWMRAVDSAAVGQTLYMQYYNTGNATAGSTAPTLGQIGEWKQYQLTSTASASGVYLFYWFPPGIQMTADIANIQFEQKGHATSFTTSARSSTQGLFDLTKNRTIDLSSMSYDSSGNMIFDGVSNYIPSIGSAVVGAGSSAYTVSVWVYRNRNNASYEELLSQWTNANSGNSFFFGFDGSNVRFTDNWNPITVSGAGNTSVWMNLVGVNTGSNAYIYLNGSLSATKGSALTYTGTGPMIFARQGALSSEYFSGKMNVVKIYNRALSAAEITQNYNHYKNRFGLT
jgi:hypothetical protein